MRPFLSATKHLKVIYTSPHHIRRPPSIQKLFRRRNFSYLLLPRRLPHHRAPPSTLLKMLAARRQSIVIPNQQISDGDPVPLKRPFLNPPAIVMTKREELIRRILVEAAEHIDRRLAEGGNVSVPEHLKNEPLILRFTGGWVRDKILAGKSNDLDVAINKMTGFEFAQRLKDWMEVNGDRFREEYENTENLDGGEEIKLTGSEETKFQGSIHKIESNPEKSKHLETATTRLLGLEIDLVNLRSESYSENSRIPHMEFGTPEQDALRRDATVNALFYNLHTKEIEDFTKRGLDDMAEKLIRTPLEPRQTFDDDPLRVLRLIRFASRLDFTIVPEVKEAMQDPGIQKSLRLKISRERVGIEMEKMLRGRDPRLSLSLIHHMNLYEPIFSPPYTEIPEDLNPDEMYTAANILYILFTDPQWKHLMDYLVRDGDEAYHAWALASMIPWLGRILSYIEDPNHKKKKEPKPLPATAVVARAGLKASNNLFNICTVTEKNFLDIQESMQGECDRKKIGMAIRRWGELWRQQFLCALLHELVPLRIHCLGKSLGVEESGADSKDLEVFERYGKFLEAVRKEGLENAHAWKPLLNGLKLASLTSINGFKTGPWMTRIVEAAVEWHFENPEATEAELEAFIVGGGMQWILEEEKAKMEAMAASKKGKKKKKADTPE